MENDQDISPPIKTSQNVVDTQKEEVIEEQVAPITSIIHEDLPKEWYFKKGHPKPSKGITTRHSLKHLNSISFISQIEPMNVDEALYDESWVFVI